jgi:flagellar biosynthesis/type III secretory pathway chaperone
VYDEGGLSMISPDRPKGYEATSLIRLLEEQVAIFTEWLNTEDKMQAALLAPNRDDLVEVISKQQELCCRLEELERKRGYALSELGVITNNATLDKLASLFSDEEEKTLRELKTKLTDLVQQVQIKTRLSKELLVQRASHNLTLLSVLTGENRVPHSYSPTADNKNELRLSNISTIYKRA